MSKSIQDQLLALGLAKEKIGEKIGEKVGEKARQAAKPKPDSRKLSPARRTSLRAPAAAKAPVTTDDISLEQAYRIRESVEKTEKQKARDRKMEEDRKRAVLNRQIRAIIDAHRLNRDDAEQARYFMYKDRIRKVHVSGEQLLQLNAGKLGVVYLAGGYHILESEHIEEVRMLSPVHVPDLLSGGDDDEELWTAFEKSTSELVDEPSRSEVIDQASELDDESGEPSTD